MIQRHSGNMGWWVGIILFTAAGVVAGYFLGLDKGPKRRPAVVGEVAPMIKEAAKEVEPPVSEVSGEKPVEIKSVEKPPIFREYDCQEMGKEIQAFFQYVRNREETHGQGKDRESQDLFTDLIIKLSLNPPIPAGEGLDSAIMMANIFHFYRILNREEIALIKAVLRNEVDSLEWHLHLFYTWLMSGDRCPHLKDQRPSFDVLYHYAGFLTNSIGGRACLYRRPLGLRLLIGYYALLIIHEADQRGENSYGIDISPEVAQLLKEISVYPAFLFQDEYIRKLTEIQNYYLERR
jgi:hypothetical protein